jgi:aarF domain-containing kinase
VLPDLTNSALFNGTFSETQAAAIIAAIIAISAISSATSATPGSSAGVASDADLPVDYDSAAIYHYWSSRPVTLFKRSLQTAWLAAGFLVGLQMDRIFGEEKKNEAKRARTLRLAIDRLGPAYIKVAQALSTRVDLLSPAYFNEITLLQDRVAPFPSKDAMAIIEVRPSAALSSALQAFPIKIGLSEGKCAQRTTLAV